MKGSLLTYLLPIVMGLIVFNELSSHAQAKVIEPEESETVVLSGGGGIFYPFQGKTGGSGAIQAMGIISPQERMGVELEYRNYKNDLLHAKNIDMQSFIFRGIGQYFFRTHGISPYIGLGLNIALNVFDEKDIEKKRDSINVKGDKGFGYGVMGLVGVEAPVAQGVALFAEGRVSADFQLTRYKNGSGKNKLDVENLSGLTGMIGIRFHF
ncbi:MAG TPA: OmpW family outer membrane protein [Nitrospirales bacterium]|nr:OmpW family outer membrane protein [Nitrospirales bacterium]